MARNNTGNPVPSASPLDREDNSKIFDELVTSKDREEVPDRLGAPLKTWHKIQKGIEEQLIAGGMIFPDETAGRLAVEDDQYFYAESNDPQISKIIWKRLNADESQFIAAEPSSIDVKITKALAERGARNSAVRNIPRTEKIRNSPLSLSVSGVQAHFCVIRNLPRGQLNTSAQGAYLVLGDSLVSGFKDQINSSRDEKYSFPNEYKSARGNCFLKEVSGVNEIILVDDGVAIQLTSGGGWLAPSLVDRNIVKAIKEDGTQYSNAFLLKNGFTVIQDDTIYHKVVTGQSLALGSRGFVETGDPEDYEYSPGLFVDVFTKSIPSPLNASCITLEGGPRPSTPTGSTGFEPAREYINGVLGETVVSSWAIAMSLWDRARIGFGAQYLGTISAFGAQPYENLKKGTTTYSNAINHVQNANDIAVSLGKQHFVGSVSIIHGESQTGTTEAEYEGYLAEWASDYKTDIVAITGQPAPPNVLISQTNTGEAGTQPAIPVAQLNAHLTGTVTLVCPKYQFRYFDVYHLYAEGYVKLGELEAKAERYLLSSGAWSPLMPLSFELIAANKIRIGFNNQPAGSQGTPGPVGLLSFDTITVSEAESFGFEMSDNNIVSAAINDDGVSVTVETASAITNGQILSYAIQDGAGQLNNRRRGNLRDTDTRDVSRYDNTPLYNWCVAFNHVITEA